MSALELISLVTQALFIGLFLVVLRDAVRNRTRAAVDTTLLFGSVAAVVAVARLSPILFGQPPAWFASLLLLLLTLAPYAMLRLVDDFSGTPRFVLAVGGAVYVAIAALGFALPAQSQLHQLAIIAWFLAVGGYAAIAFDRARRRTRGITRRRMRAIVVGAGLFVGAIVVLLADAMTGERTIALQVLAQVAGLGAVMAFFLGFAPPSWVRRAWREPDLRAFLESSVHLVSVGDDHLAVSQLQHAVAAAAGADGASIGVADPQESVIRYASQTGEWLTYPDDAFIAGAAYTQQRRVIAVDAAAVDPEHAQTYATTNARTVIAAPVTRDGRRIGVLAVYADRAPIFIEEDLWLIELFADHVAVLLEARDLARQAGLLEAREEAARLKEEFLSAAAHDLRTPLTVVLGQAELLERRVASDPSRPVDAAGVARLANEARRLRDLVSEMLDAQRLEQGGIIMDRRLADLRDVVEAIGLRHGDDAAAVEVRAPADPVPASVDMTRIQQVIDNLIENALKYGPGAARPELSVWAADGEARMAVIDHGVGIPEAEQDRIFERFYRASNAQGITDTGMGLGLYICRRIVEEHGGRIWMEPTPGGGSTFQVSLPLEPVRDDVESPADQPSWTPSGGAEAMVDA